LPILTLDTNQSIAPEHCTELLHKASDLLVNMLAKPKSSIMVRINPAAHLMIDDSTEPTAYIQLKLFAFPQEQAAGFVKTITEFVQTELGVAPDRQYHRLIDMQPSMFGWNGSTC
jgi:phenylpyruvate tautomerase PptA (4-oxalocrotonate tautomerase family)